jgi:NADH-quinone oxidoreductase subunit L
MSATLIFLVIGLPWLGGLLVWLSGDKRPRFQHGMAVFFSLAAAAAALLLLKGTTATAVIAIPFGTVFGDLTFVPDGLGVTLTIIATVIGSLAVIFSVDYMRGAAQLGRYYAFVLYFIGTMAGLALSGSLLFMFVFWEITAFCSYALISFYNDDPKAVRGGVKALIITQLGGVGLLAGALIAYSSNGDYQIATLLAQAESLPPTLLAWLAFGGLAAAAAKSAQVPLHTWLPDAMEAPSPVSALIHAATMVNAGVYLLARFYPAFSRVPGWETAVVIVGALSALLAALMALTANDLKRVLAYSTISQLGYMVYAIGVGDVFASQFHLLSHAIFKALLFLAAGALIHAVGTRDMREMGGLGAEMPFVRLTFLTSAFALAGLPIVNGFWSKELVLEAGWMAGPRWAYLIMLLGAGITALYTFRMTWMVFYAPSQRRDKAHKAATAMRISLAALAVGNLFAWLLAGPLNQLLQVTLPHHHLHHWQTGELALTLLTAPTTWLALLVVGAGLAAWWYRNRLQGAQTQLTKLIFLPKNEFGFEEVNQWITSSTQGAARLVSRTQTGQLNWNIVGILLTLIVVVIILAGSI